MTYLADGEPCTYFGVDPQRLRAVGWLDADHPYTKGSVERATFDRLITFVRNPWQPLVYKGWHTCELCPASNGFPITRFTWKGRPVPVGVANLFIPGEGFLWTAPSMIVHYIADHGYRPPDEFLAAVDASPGNLTPEYLQEVALNGPWAEVP